MVILERIQMISAVDSQCDMAYLTEIQRGGKEEHIINGVQSDEGWSDETFIRDRSFMVTTRKHSQNSPAKSAPSLNALCPEERCAQYDDTRSAFSKTKNRPPEKPG